MSQATPDPDGAPVRFPPPFVPVIALFVGLAVHLFIRAWPLPVSMAVRSILGTTLLLVGGGLMAGALGLFRHTGQDPKPWLPTPEIISTGIYRYTRNPMYLSMGLLQAGLGVWLANAWIVALVPVTWITIYWIAIRHEEAYLDARFGSSYLDYKASVRRWL